MRYGLDTVLARDSWQVGTLNYSEEYHIDHINCLTKHQKSDKAVSILVGVAMLITRVDDQSSDFKTVQMKHGTSYNIPKNSAYVIALGEGSQLFIVEKPHTHSEDVTKCYLSEAQLKTIRQKVTTQEGEKEK